MDYLLRMNDALNYIENNLDGEIDYEIAASKACCSVFYFQRMFSFIADITLSEYIRRRRLTLAAFELQNSKVKIIDLAIKYGYDSPDSFSRAFQKLHGIIPSKARNIGITLKAFPRITFHISIKGDVEMNYKIEEKEAFKVVGIKKHYKGPEDDATVVGSFWNELYEKGLLKVISDLSTETTKGVHGFIQVLGDEEVDYMIASISDKEPPEGMTSQVIPKSTWAIFELVGPVNSTLETAWKRIFTEWLPTSTYQYAEAIDIEYFPNDGFEGAEDYKFEIWLPVIRK
ncbi:AraC family transcriptional regulator [Anaerosporobacter sp.]